MPAGNQPLIQRPRRQRGLIALAAALVLLLWAGVGLAGPRPVEVSVLMPAPFADATAPLVAGFNREHREVQIAVTRGPLDTEALSDLTISSLLLGDTPYDLLLMDVTWTPKYAAAGWLEPLEPLLGDHAMDGMAAGAQLGNAFGGGIDRTGHAARAGRLDGTQADDEILEVEGRPAAGGTDDRSGAVDRQCVGGAAEEDVVPVGIDEHAFDSLQAAEELHLGRKRRALRSRLLHCRSDGLERHRAQLACLARPAGVGQGPGPFGRQ